jgi:hypothetical protein
MSPPRRRKKVCICDDGGRIVSSLYVAKLLSLKHLGCSVSKDNGKTKVRQ